MIGKKTLIFGFLICTICRGTQAVDNTTIEPRVVEQQLMLRAPVLFKHFSMVIEAKPQPEVYGCSYHKTDNASVDDNICLTMIKNGQLQPLIALNTTEENLRYIILPNCFGYNSLDHSGPK